MKVKIKNEKVSSVEVVRWDGKFATADLLKDVFREIPYSTHEGALTYWDGKRIVGILRGSYVLRDGDEIKSYCQSGDSLLENDYDIINK